MVVNDHGGDVLGGQGDSAPAEVVVTEIAGRGGTVVAEGSDVSVGAAAIVERASDASGGLHGVINNAGIDGRGTLNTVRNDEFERSIEDSLARLDEALGADDFYVPTSGMDDIPYAGAQLGLDRAAERPWS